jgi:NADH:ubiquinone oxidoreductase subunit 3 (subunit A)
MAKIESSFKNMLLVLFIISVIAAVALAGFMVLQKNLLKNREHKNNKMP